MPNIKLTLQYDGTRYLGWTRPAADGYAKTISYRISSVLQKMTGEDITLFAGAKTAPGVHALCQPGPSRFKKASQLYELRMPQAMRSHIGR